MHSSLATNRIMNVIHDNNIEALETQIQHGKTCNIQFQIINEE
jgi:hypothetical protein